MSKTSTDTHLDTEKAKIELIRNLAPWRKFEMISEMHARTKSLAGIQLRLRYPEADECEIRRRLADVLLGTELASEVYGPLGSDEPTVLINALGKPCDIRSLGDIITENYHQELFAQLIPDSH